MPHSPPASKHSKTLEAIQNAKTTLQLAISLAPLIPVPVLSSLFTAASCIVDASIKIRQNKKEVAELSECIAGITCQIHKTLRGKEEMIDKELNLALTVLQGIFDEIRMQLEYHLSMGLWDRICRRSSISEKTTEYKNRLGYAMSTFTTTSNMRQEIALRSLKNGMDSLESASRNNQMFNGQFRRYRWGELEILSRHDLPLSTWYTSDTELYDAKVDGSVKFLKVYRDREAFSHALAVLQLVREMPKIPFAQLEGHGEDTSSPFLILKGCYRNMFQYLRDLDLIEYFDKRLDYMIDMKHGMVFLASHGLQWNGWVEGLMVSETGRLCLGCNDDIIPRVDNSGVENKILISWPKPNLPEGLHVLVEREDRALPALQAALQNSNGFLDIKLMSGLWEAYVTELNCGITSFVTVKNMEPPQLGSIGCMVSDGDGLRFQLMDDKKFKTPVKLRSTWSWEGASFTANSSRRYGDNKERDRRLLGSFDIEGQEGKLYMDRTSYIHVATHGWAADYLIRNGKDIQRLGFDLAEVIIGVIERSTAKFAGTRPECRVNGERPRIRFHAYAAGDCGFLRKPWGVFCEDATIGGLPCAECQPKSVAPNKREQCTNGTISAEIEQSYKLSCFQFSVTEVAVIKRMYNRIASVGNAND